MGSFYLAVASSTMILGISWLGNLYAWNSPQIISLLGISIVFWSLFLRTESKAHEPMLDITVLTNRTFLIASLSSLISLVGITAIMAYFPLFLQGVQGVNATLSGNIITPLSLLMSLMGIPAGLLIAKTKRYKWMYVAGYAILTIAMFSMLALKADTAVGWGFVITTVAGIGLGTIPTINALVVQYAVPKRLLGVATGGLYFFVMMGRAIAPAILGSAMNTSYTSSLAAQLPKSLNQFLDEAALSSLSNPRVLLSETAMSDLKVIFSGLGDQASGLFAQTVQAIRSALEAGLHTLFWIGAITMLLSFLLILAIPEISLDGETQQ
jgi:MFS family permease